MAVVNKDPYAKPVLIGGLVVIGAAALVLVSSLFHTISRNSTVGAQDNTMAVAAAADNIKPIGTVVTVDKSVAPVARTGEQVYTAVCTSCHTAGVLNAPKPDDKAAWEPRVAKGLKGLLTSATNGLNQMPAKGGDPSLTDQELTDAIVYMTAKAGFDLSKEAQAAAPAGGAAPAAAATQAAPAAQGAAPAAQAAGGNGEKTYRSACFACHDAGVANAPKLGDKAAWGPRIANGMDTLYTHSLTGFNAMPAKGGNAALSDDDVKAAVDFMVSQGK
ncbi:c-type cytochrome [Thiolinea disciformis]|uniref:c-type cytochrome n=1 Tax=Thiolinea disciformis TaxID=125614 RepID=UPI0003767A5C|nr:c-type cytochrome [Thiolinea disciformis]